MATEDKKNKVTKDAMADAGLSISYEDDDNTKSNDTKINYTNTNVTDSVDSDTDANEAADILDKVLNTNKQSSKSRQSEKSDQNINIDHQNTDVVDNHETTDTSDNTQLDSTVNNFTFEDEQLDSAPAFSDFTDVPDTNIIIKFIDQTNNDSRIKTLMGQPSTTADYTTEADIRQHISNGYEIIKDETNGKQPIFGKSNKTYRIIMKHKLEDVSRTKVVTEKIDYSMSDDTIAPDEKINTLEFEQKGTKDLVTNRITWDNKAITKEFPQVKSPVIKGYECDTPVLKSIPVTLTIDNFNTSLDIKKTINYIAEPQKIILKFVDKTSNLVRTKPLHGSTNKHSGYYATDTIDQFLNRGYQLIKDETNGQELVYDNNTNQDQVYTIELKHKTKRLTPDDSFNDIKNRDEHDNLVHVVKREIVFRTPNLLPDIDPITQTAEFTRDAVLDLVTGHINYGEWSDSTVFDEVIPDKLNGYQATPAVIKKEAVSYDTKNQTIHVGYTAKPKKIQVIYYDTLKKEPIKTITLQGKSDENSHYLTNDAIMQYRHKGYSVLDDPTDGNELIFDRDQTDQKVIIKLGHLTRKVDLEHPINPVTHKDLRNELSKHVTRTIEFEVPKNQTPIQKQTQTVGFTRTGETDLITGETQFADFTESKSFAEIKTPNIEGYKAILNDKEITTIPEETITGNDSNYTLSVKYNPTQQSINLIIYDTDEQDEIVNKTLTGYTNAPINFNKAQLLKNLANKHYKVINDDFHLTKFPVKSPVTCKITVKHQHLTLTVDKPYNPLKDYDYTDQLTRKSTFEIQYVYHHTGEEAAPSMHKELSFKRNADLDLVTGDIDYGEWQETTQMSNIVSPTVDHYTPSKKVITHNDLANSDNTVITVEYYANHQAIVFKYYCNKRLVKTAPAKISLKDKKNHSVDSLIKEVTDLGYAIDDHQHYPNVVHYDSNLNDKRVYDINVHETFTKSTNTKDIIREITVTMPDNNMRVIKQITTLKQPVTTSNVTKKVSYGTWNQGLWDAITPATVNGLKPSIDKLPQKTVNSETKSETINITYRKDSVSTETTEPKREEVKQEKDKPSFFDRLFHRKNNDDSYQKALPAPNKSSKQ